MNFQMGLALVTTLALGSGTSLGVQNSGTKGSNAGHRAPASAPASQPAKRYFCPMHPEVTSDKPAKCPKCGMNLELQKDKDQARQGQKNQKCEHGQHCH